MREGVEKVINVNDVSGRGEKRSGVGVSGRSQTEVQTSGSDTSCPTISNVT